MLRLATLDDIPRMIELGRAMHAESPAFSAMSFDADRLADTARAAITSSHGFAAVAEREGVVVGGLLAMATPHYFSRDLIACDLALFIDSGYRGGMAGPRLIGAYAQWARSIGAAKTLLACMAGINSDVLEALCLRLGGRRAGVVMEF